MEPRRTSPDPPPVVAFGPEADGFGSWDWVGADLLGALDGRFRARTFRAWEVPDCDALVVVKHAPPPDWAEAAARRAAVLYCPVDAYGSAAAIDADAPMLRRCDRLLVHCERLRRYFEPYAPVEYLDHHVKFAAPTRDRPRPDGDLLWVGVRTNLPPLIRWVNDHPPPAPLDVLTNPEDPRRMPTPADLGFRPGLPVRVHAWSPERQLALTAAASASIACARRRSTTRSATAPPCTRCGSLPGTPTSVPPRSTSSARKKTPRSPPAASRSGSRGARASEPAAVRAAVGAA